ncbi:potassium transporter Kup [Verticiella sediminum]|uniref:Probable potassium transport system protein Kup n=1 Tax=Verticiella sediminum TaxID=1247510 RepID=A0A556A7K3_9BURK|nr:potassium transporter Kup [Verticiella sediminum]TSH88839.1 potassium transporter Kup [Verticiella sediminum]
MSSARISLPALTLGALGVVYGDIGTSVLYATKEVFGQGHVAMTTANVYGISSLIFWTLTVIVSIKYVLLVLRADNAGEGGLVAMLALASQAVVDKPGLRRWLLALGIFGTSLFYGDGVITPAISVLSAIEGLEVISPALAPYVLPATLLVLFLLFAMQKRGTGGIGRLFGPVTLVWFGVIALLGANQILRHPEILAALLPTYALGFILENPGTTFIILGATVLCVTGAEALYADLGHFGKRPIRLAWYLVVMPALTLNYFGQGALLLEDPQAIRNPFYLMVPAWGVIPLVVLATAATVIASQALITGAFSVTRQVIQLGYLPRLHVQYTSAEHAGRIYIPAVNWSLFVAIAFAVVLFGSSSRLAGAYGIAVTLDMLITTILTFFVLRYAWRYPLVLCVFATGVFFVIDALFFASNLLKLFDGGWFPLLIGASMFLLMMTWCRGRQLVAQAQQAHAIALPAFLDSVFQHPPERVPGTAVFMTANAGTVPDALLHNLKHNKVLHENNLFVTLVPHEVPRIPPEQRLYASALGNRCWELQVHTGFTDDLDLAATIERAGLPGCRLDAMTTSYFLSRVIVVSTPGAGMAPWREKLFVQMHRNASDAADFLHLPANAVVELGGKVEI